MLMAIPLNIVNVIDNLLRRYWEKIESWNDTIRLLLIKFLVVWEWCYDETRFIKNVFVINV